MANKMFVKTFVKNLYYIRFNTKFDILLSRAYNKGGILPICHKQVCSKITH